MKSLTLKEAAELLYSAGIEDAKREARIIFSHYLALPSYAVWPLDEKTENERVISAILRRAKREPLQYILGSVGFYREEYKVTPDCLIPRPETELLVDYAVKHLPAESKFIDLCTGSGCIALSVLNNTEKTTACAVDISRGALSVASENAASLGLSERVIFTLADAKSETTRNEVFPGEQVYAVLSNPPYVTDSAYRSLEREIYYEPREAFVGGADGADFYRAITALYKEKIADCGFIAYEIGYDQADLVAKTADMQNMKTEIIKDLSGLDRIAVLRKA